MDIYVNSLYKITNIAINQQMDTIIVSTVHSQIYIGMLFVPETLQIRELEFKTLGEPLHIAGITGMSICSWKPIIMTCCEYEVVLLKCLWSIGTYLMFSVDLSASKSNPIEVKLALPT